MSSSSAGSWPPQTRELIERGQRDVRLDIFRRRDERPARAVIAPDGEPAQRVEPHHCCRVLQPSRENAGTFAAGGGGAHRQPPDLRIRIGRRMDDEQLVDRRRAEERFDREAADARIAQTLGPTARVVVVDAGEHAQRGDGAIARWPPAMLAADERLEPFRDAEAIGDGVGPIGHVNERGFRLGGIVGALVRQAADGFAQRRADTRPFFVVELRDECRQHGAEVGLAERPRHRFVPALRGLADRVGGLGTDLGKREPQCRNEVGDERRALEAADRTDRENGRLRIAAADPGAQRQQVCWGRGAPLLGLKDRETARAPRPRLAGRAGPRARRAPRG